MRSTDYFWVEEGVLVRYRGPGEEDDPGGRDFEDTVRLVPEVDPWRGRDDSGGRD